MRREDMSEDLFAAFVGVNGVSLEPFEVLAALADIPAPGGLHIQEGGFRFASELFEVRAIVAVTIGIAYPLPLSVVARIDAPEGARHQENVRLGCFSDLADHIPDRADIAPLADAANNDEVRIVIEDEFLKALRLFVPPAAG